MVTYADRKPFEAQLAQGLVKVLLSINQVRDAHLDVEDILRVHRWDCSAPDVIDP